MNYLEFEPNGVSNGLDVGTEAMGILRWLCICEMIYSADNVAIYWGGKEGSETNMLTLETPWDTRWDVCKEI